MKFLYIFVSILISYSTICAQSFGIGTDSPNPNSILDVFSTSKGVLVPRLTTSQRNANLTGLVAADEGLLIYNTTEVAFNYWNGSAWISFPGSGGNDADWDNIGSLLSPSDGITEDVAIGTATALGKLTVEDLVDNARPSIVVNRNSSTANTYGIEINSSVSNGGGGLYNDLDNYVSTITELNAIHNDFTGLTNFNTNNLTRGIYNDFNMSAAVAVSGMENNFDGTNNQLKHGVLNNFSASSVGYKYGMRNNFNSTAVVFGPKYGIANYFTASSFGDQNGFYNEFSGSSSVAKYGVTNKFLPITEGDNYAIYNEFDATADFINMYGLENRFDAPGSGLKYGVRNVFLAGSGYGMINVFYGTSTGGKIGTATTFNNTAGGRHTGHTVNINSTNNEFKQAYVADFGNGALGSAMVGLDVDFNASGSDPKYGVRVVVGSVTPGINHAFDVNMGTKPQDYAAYFIGKQYISYRLGVGVQLPNYMLEVGANSAAKPASSAWIVTSDKRLKKDVKPFTDGLNVIQKINPVWFTYNGLANMPDETGVGTIAQELKEVAPYMVGTWEYMDSVDFSTKEYLNADYGSLDFVLVNAVQEQQEMIEKLKNQNQSLEEIVKKLVIRLDELENFISK